MNKVLQYILDNMQYATEICPYCEEEFPAGRLHIDECRELLRRKDEPEESKDIEEDG